MADKVIERQELQCHACGKYVQFDIDLSLNGNHVLNCPNCGHEHCFVSGVGEHRRKLMRHQQEMSRTIVGESPNQKGDTGYRGGGILL